MTYRERLWPAPWLYIATALVIPASFLVFLPINPVVGVVVAVVLYAGCVVTLLLSAPTIVVSDQGVRAGKATLPFSAMGEPHGFRGEEASLERGQRLDARAWLMIRGWVDPVVRVPVTDDGDPAPYWLLSSRKPDELIAAIASARSAS